jgi:NADH-quinone oxidoreductase subunit H
LRAVAQFISYEICGGLCFIFIALLSQSLNLFEIVLVQKFCGPFCYYGLPFFFSLFICILAETNRTPFDVSESESELVAGFHIEYSSTGFALFFLGEYGNILALSTVFVLVFLGG